MPKFGDDNIEVKVPGKNSVLGLFKHEDIEKLAVFGQKFTVEFLEYFCDNLVPEDKKRAGGGFEIQPEQIVGSLCVVVLTSLATLGDIFNKALSDKEEAKFDIENILEKFSGMLEMARAVAVSRKKLAELEKKISENADEEEETADEENVN